MFSDDSATKISQSLLPNEWKELRIPEDSQIKKVEIMYRKYDSCLFGLKFSDADNRTLLMTSNHFDDHEIRHSDCHRYAFYEFTLDTNERLVGVKSGQRGYDDAKHFDVQFKIGKE